MRLMTLFTINRCRSSSEFPAFRKPRGRLVVLSRSTKTRTMLEVVRKCGIPDKHAGSDVYIFAYYMKDCSTVTGRHPGLKAVRDLPCETEKDHCPI